MSNLNLLQPIQPPAKLPRDETTSAAVRELDFSAASEPSMLKALEERRRNGALEPTEPFSSCRSQGHGDVEIQGFDMVGCCCSVESSRSGPWSIAKTIQE